MAGMHMAVATEAVAAEAGGGIQTAKSKVAPSELQHLQRPQEVCRTVRSASDKVSPN
jgi:hypothetical protein